MLLIVARGAEATFLKDLGRNTAYPRLILLMPTWQSYLGILVRYHSDIALLPQYACLPKPMSDLRREGDSNRIADVENTNQVCQNNGRIMSLRQMN